SFLALIGIGSHAQTDLAPRLSFMPATHSRAAIVRDALTTRSLFCSSSTQRRYGSLLASISGCSILRKIGEASLGRCGANSHQGSLIAGSISTARVWVLDRSSSSLSANVACSAISSGEHRAKLIPKL